MIITEKAYAKINLALDVIKKRTDGYHEVNMIMQSIDLYDEVSVKKAPYLNVTMHGGEIPSADNIAFKTAKLLAAYAGKETDIHISIEKNIPMAAGLAGGSSDAAAVLRILNKFWGLNYSNEKLESIAAQVGSDVPFCISGITALATGRGEIITRLEPCPEFFVVLACPYIEVSTAWVYKNYNRKNIKDIPDVEKVIQAIKRKDKESIIEGLNNTLESVTIKEYPIINEIKKVMVEAGAHKCLMSGSGPTVFTLTETLAEAQKISNELKTKINARVWLSKTRRVS